MPEVHAVTQGLLMARSGHVKDQVRASSCHGCGEPARTRAWQGAGLVTGNGWSRAMEERKALFVEVARRSLALPRLSRPPVSRNTGPSLSLEAVRSELSRAWPTLQRLWTSVPQYAGTIPDFGHLRLLQFGKNTGAWRVSVGNSNCGKIRCGGGRGIGAPDRTTAQ
jgi:hypothetical protein